MTPPFNIEGPDDEGNVWLMIGMRTLNLGPKDQVVEILSQWLASIDHEERL